MTKQEQKKLLAKIAYLYYIEGKNQFQISKETGIYRTTISRMLARARSEGIVKIEIAHFDTHLFQLENEVREKYGLRGIDIVEPLQDEDISDFEQRLSQTAADALLSLISDNMTIGFSWGKSLSMMVERLGNHRRKSLHFYPLCGGPSYINARYHVNTLIYDMANKFRGECHFVNATVVQENALLAQGILSSKYFERLKEDWKVLDLAVIGIGGEIDEHNPQWLDMLTQTDFEKMRNMSAVGEICCRLFDESGEALYPDLQDRTIAIPLEDLQQIPYRMGFAYGLQKAKAILAALKAGYINYLVTDLETILAVLALDGDAPSSS